VKAHSVLWGHLLLPPFCSIWCEPKDCSLNLMLRSLGFLSEFHRILESHNHIFLPEDGLRLGFDFLGTGAQQLCLTRCFEWVESLEDLNSYQFNGISKFRGLDFFFRIWMILDWHIVYKNLLHTKGQSQTDTGGFVEICSDVDQ
jgi:hypothetical protein